MTELKPHFLNLISAKTTHRPICHTYVISSLERRVIFWIFRPGPAQRMEAVCGRERRTVLFFRPLLVSKYLPVVAGRDRDVIMPSLTEFILEEVTLQREGEEEGLF